MNKKIAAICGSTRSNSTNLLYIKAFAALSDGIFDVSIFEGIAGIPHFNPDLDTENPPAPVTEFRKQLKESDGVLICTPEYAMGVPGTLKNAIDWTVSSSEFYKKPVALITASSMGEKGHKALLETLRIIDCNITDDTQLVISHAKTKINAGAVITDAKTLRQVGALINSFAKLIEVNAESEF